MKRYISAILIPCLVLQFTGCYSSNYITKDKFLLDEKGDIELTTYDDKIYNLEERHYTVMNDTIFIDDGPTYINPYDELYIPLNEVKQYEASQFNTTKTLIWATIGVLVIIGLYALKDFKMGGQSTTSGYGALTTN